jgi:hypothetical protein
VSRPPASPWLDHLRRDRRGLPVPYLNAWGPENARVDADPRAGGPAWFRDDVGDVPDFTAMNPQRQRECMVDGLCSVCGKFVPWSRRNLVIAALAVEWVQTPSGREVPVVMEPWLCDRCAHIAVHWCPSLVRRRREEQLQVVPVRSSREVVPVVSVGELTVPGLEWTRARPVRLWVKLRLLTLDIQRAPEAVSGSK